MKWLSMASATSWDVWKAHLSRVVLLLTLSAVCLVGLFVHYEWDESDVQAKVIEGDTAWLLIASALVMFMTPGLAFFYGGLVDHKNIIATMMQSFICLGVVGVLWIVVGFSLAFGSDCGSFIGNPWTYLWFRNVNGTPHPSYGPTIPLRLFAAFQLKFAVITPALTAGGYIERFRFAPYLLFVVLFSLIVYCPVAHWVWAADGFIHKWGVKDFAGGMVVHMTSGFSALAGCIVIGPRRKFRLGEDVPVNVTYVVLGMGMLWFGWFGFNAGSELAADTVAAQAFLTTNTATAAAMVTWEALSGLAGKKLSVVGACVGALCGLIAITPACAYVTVGESLFVGGFASAVCFVAMWLMHKTPVDDGLDAFATHGVGGITGSILTGVFMADVGVVHGPAGERWRYFGYFWAAVAAVGAWAFVWSLLIFKGLDLTLGLRMSAEEEDLGLDEVQHDAGLYKWSGLKASDDHVAEQCAEAIGKLDFEHVSWLSEVPRPSRIQASFLQILSVLEVVKPFVPDHIFAALLAQGAAEEPDEDEEEEEANSCSPTSSGSRSTDSAGHSPDHGLMLDMLPGQQSHRLSIAGPLTSALPSSRRTVVVNVSPRPGSPRSPKSPASMHSASTATTTKAKQSRCVFLSARVELLPQRTESAGVLGDIVTALVKVGKDHQGTIDQVTLGAVSLHWGLLGPQAGAPLKAVTAALQMLEAVGLVVEPHRRAVRLQIAVSYGAVACATVKAAGYSFFVVGGATVDLPARVVAEGVPERMGCGILITEAVRREVQYNIACSPRLWYADTLWFQPTHTWNGGSQEDEWMYQLQRMGRQFTGDVAAISDVLLGLLKLVRTGASAEELRSEANAVRDRFGPRLTLADHRTLAQLCGGGQEPKAAAPSSSSGRPTSRAYSRRSISHLPVIPAW